MEPCEIPEAAGMTPGEAGAALEKVRRAAACDPHHAYTDGHHPGHRAALDAMKALHEVYAEREPEPTIFDLALAERDAKCEAMRDEAQTEADLLTDLGYGETEIPENIQPYQLSALKLRRFAAEGDFDSLAPLLQKELLGLQTSGDVWADFSTFTREKKNPDLRAQIAERLVTHVVAANKAKYEGKKK